MAQDLLFFAYRDFTNAADVILEELGLGRAHHRVLHFIGRNPGITVSDLLGILRITKQSLGRVLSALMEQGYVAQAPGRTDRRQRLLTLTAKGAALERRLFERQQRAAAAGLSRGRRRGGGGLPPGDARHHGRRRARLYRPPHRPRTARRLMRRRTPTSWWSTTTRGCARCCRATWPAGLPRHHRRDAADARDKLRLHASDLMVLDVMMPGESGLTLTEALRRDRAATCRS